MSSLLVVFTIAESTTIGRSSGNLRMRTSRIRSVEATDDPPNFITTVSSPSPPLSCAAATEASFSLTMAATLTACWHRTAAFPKHGVAGTAAGAKALRRLAVVGRSSASPSRAVVVVRRAGAAMPVPRGWSWSRWRLEAWPRVGARRTDGGE